MRELQGVVIGSSRRFSAPVVTGRSDYFRIISSTVIQKPFHYLVTVETCPTAEHNRAVPNWGLSFCRSHDFVFFISFFQVLQFSRLFKKSTHAIIVRTERGIYQKKKKNFLI